MNSSAYLFLILLLVFLCSESNAQRAVLAHHPTSNAPVASTSVKAPVFAPATFPGGEEVFLATIGQRLTYPELAREYGIEGTVVVKLQLDRTGKVTDRTVIQPLGFGCDAAALTALEELPHWQPARRLGRRTESFVYVPLRFRLR
ncbi:MAG: energy transducer TonB [Bacteroidota bacterium]